MSGFFHVNFAMLRYTIVRIDDFVLAPRSMVMDRSGRKLIRKNKRLKMKFGSEEPSRAAFTGNTSSGGIHVVTNMPEHPGTSLKLWIVLPDGQEVVVSGIVCWAKKVPTNLMRMTKFAGMGVKFTHFECGRQAYQEFVENLRF